MPTIGFTGHVNDADTGLVYMQQRYYDPVAGRFLSIDPVVTDANTGVSFNRYAYGNNNPYRYVDPDGRDAAERFVEQHRLDLQAGNGAVYEPLQPIAVGGLVAVTTFGMGTAAVGAYGTQKAGIAALFLVNALGKTVVTGPKPPSLPAQGIAAAMRAIRGIKKESTVAPAKVEGPPTPPTPTTPTTPTPTTPSPPPTPAPVLPL